ncbi:MAG: hypothetical protein GXO96_03335 [Nitrospirae bacterium]|nr:hypothetical protein [Candidatus Manganitrophaceae bacterium]
MGNLKNNLGDVLQKLKNAKHGDREALLAEYEEVLTAFHQKVLESARSRKPETSFLARVGFGDLAWVLHLNRDYKAVGESLSVLNALTPEPSLEEIKRRPKWPEGFDPSAKKRAMFWNPFSWGALSVAVKNKLVFPGIPPQEIFTRIQDAKNWGNYYANGGEASVEQIKKIGQTFSFRTFNMIFKSKIVTLKDKGEVLSIAWHAKSLGTEVVHRWDIYSDKNGGAIVTTEETQRGIKPLLTAIMLKPAMEITHQNWLIGHGVAAIKSR